MWRILRVQLSVFFFQAEDGIRDYKVTGVQTCALPIYVVEGFTHGFVKRGMGVDGVHHGFDGGLGFHGGDGFRDQLEGLRTNDVDAEDLAECFVGYHLYKTIVAAEDAGLAVGAERELANLHFEALRFGLCLGESDAADAGVGVGGAGDAILVDRPDGFAGHVRDGDHAFHGRNVGKLRRAGHYVADGVDAGLAGLLVLVDLDETAVEIDLRAFEADVFGVGLAANRDEQGLGFELLLLAVGESGGELDTVIGLANVVNLGPGLAADAGLLERALQLLRNLFVLDRYDARQHFENRHLGSEAVKDGRELDADGARADDEHRFREGGEVEDLDVGEDRLGIGLEGSEEPTSELQ